MHEKFRRQNFFETRKGPPTKIFGTETKKIPTENRDTPPPLLSIKFFDTRSFLKHRRVPLRKVWVL